jgi:predicted dehydrogenase/aryl-alcohol dehydrogenase-like predicted oxidoreductase
MSTTNCSVSTLNWGVLGTGNIAKTFAKGVVGSTSGKLVAVGSRSHESADKFAAEFGIPNRHGSYDALLADPEVHAVYISTPHPLHAEWAVKAARARKHVLVEKPIGLNYAEAMVITEAALENDVFLMEAFMYRCHPQTARLVELVKNRVIGELRLIQADFSFHWPKPWNDQSRLISNALGGGGILDVGCYPVSMSRLLAGAYLGRPFAEPEDFKAMGHVGKTGVDEFAVALMKFSGGVLAQISTGVQLNRENGVTLYGSEGRIHVPKPWIPGQSEKILVYRSGKEVEEIVVESKLGLYSLEADTVARYLAQRQSPTMSWEDSLGNIRVLDRWRDQIGVVYESEKLENARPIPPRRLTRPPTVKMTYGNIPGLAKPVSRLIVGADFSGGNHRDAYAIFDAFFEVGGNCFDTSVIYGPQHQKSDTVLGAWVRTRSVKDDVVLLIKGAHTPDCFPEKADDQVKVTLERMKLDSADLYCFHRDNPAVPVGEFVAVCNKWIREGKIKAWGGSNWTIARMQEAIDYAGRNGLEPPRMLSNQFSLARMVEPPWGGCISASNPEERAWLAKGQVALLPWSSQARGFFVDGMAHPDRRENAELVRCWYAEDNFKRLDRVKELAARKNVLPINIALAYVLCQPFPTFPLIGPRLIREVRTSLPGLDVQLTEHDLKYLNLEV